MFHFECIRCKKRLRSAGKYKIGLYKIAYFSSVLHGYRLNTPVNTKLPHCIKERLHKRYHNRPEAMISVPYYGISYCVPSVIKYLLDSSTLSTRAKIPLPGVPQQNQNTSRHLTHKPKVLILLERKRRS